jgi:hypothetical protein
VLTVAVLESSRFNELLKEFHDHENVGRIELERIRRFGEFSAIPVLKHYKQGRASWVFDVETPVEIDEVMREHRSSESACFVDFPKLILKLNIADRGILDRWIEKPVLVSAVEFVYGPDGRIPSTVGLYLAHEESEEPGGGDVYLELREGSFKRIRSGKAGKLISSPISTGDQSHNRVQPNIIQSTFQIVDGISEDHGKIIYQGHDIFRVCKATLDSFTSSVRVYMDTGHQSFLQAVNARFKVRNVLVGPLDLSTGTYAG